MLDSVHLEGSLLDGTDVAFPAGLVGDSVPLAEIFVQEEDRDRAKEREESDDRANPESPGVGAKVLRNNVGSGLSRELSEIGDTPTRKS